MLLKQTPHDQGSLWKEELIGVLLSREWVHDHLGGGMAQTGRHGAGAPADIFHPYWQAAARESWLEMVQDLETSNPTPSDTPSTRYNPNPSQMVPPPGDHVFKYMHLWGPSSSKLPVSLPWFVLFFLCLLIFIFYILRLSALRGIPWLSPHYCKAAISCRLDKLMHLFTYQWSFWAASYVTWELSFYKIDIQTSLCVDMVFTWDTIQKTSSLSFADRTGCVSHPRK